MNWIVLQQQASSAYNTFAEFVYDNPVMTDLVGAAVVVGSLLYLKKVAVRKRLQRARRRWGVQMQRSKNKQAYQRAELAFAIEDKLFDMVYAGEMTSGDADDWRHSFASFYQMEELRPVRDQKSVKKSIRRRLNTLVHKWKPTLTGPKPGHGMKIDETYKPVFLSVVEGSSKSKYLKVA